MRRAPTGSGTGTGRVTLAPFPCPCGVTRTFLQRPCAGAADRLRRKGLHRGHQQGFEELGGRAPPFGVSLRCLTRGVHSRTLVITPPVTIVGVIAYFVASQPWLASTHHPNRCHVRIRAVATMRVALLLACVAGAHGALELNKGTFDKEVKQSGKNGARPLSPRTAPPRPAPSSASCSPPMNPQPFKRARVTPIRCSQRSSSSWLPGEATASR